VTGLLVVSFDKVPEIAGVLLYQSNQINVLIHYYPHTESFFFSNGYTRSTHKIFRDNGSMAQMGKFDQLIQNSDGPKQSQWVILTIEPCYT